jgi:hypothetical protein
MRQREFRPAARFAQVFGGRFQAMQQCEEEIAARRLGRWLAFDRVPIGCDRIVHERKLPARVTELGPKLCLARRERERGFEAARRAFHVAGAAVAIGLRGGPGRVPGFETDENPELFCSERVFAACDERFCA